MKRARLGALVISSLAAGALALGLAGSASAAPARPAVSTPSSVRTVVFDCPGDAVPLVRPRTFILTCADANSLFDKLTWTSWTPGLASAKGLYQENDCTPNCADGHFHSYPVLVIFWGIKAVPNHPGELCYTMMTEILPGARPLYYNGHKWVPVLVTQTSRLFVPSGGRPPHA
jgi:hypothetical protein